jgi:hypothetical protein
VDLLPNAIFTLATPDLHQIFRRIFLRIFQALNPEYPLGQAKTSDKAGGALSYWQFRLALDG